MKSRLDEISKLDNNQLPFRSLRGKSLLRRQPKPVNLSRLNTPTVFSLAINKLEEFEKARNRYFRKATSIFLAMTLFSIFLML